MHIKAGITILPQQKFRENLEAPAQVKYQSHWKGSQKRLISLMKYLSGISHVSSIDDELKDSMVALLGHRIIEL